MKEIKRLEAEYQGISIPKKVRYEIFEDGEQLGRPMTIVSGVTKLVTESARNVEHSKTVARSRP